MFFSWVVVLCALAFTPSLATLRVYSLVLSDGWMSPDGNERAVISFNGTLPGPTLRARRGDTVEVWLHNMMMERVASFHVHGLVFRGQPWQDGVPMVTQCPVAPGQRFRYRFVVQQSAGSYWYHSHVAGQVGDGAFGWFIIEDEDLASQPQVALDATMAVSAWWWRDQHSLYSQWNMFSKGAAPESHDHMYFMEMSSVLINGKARSSKNSSRPLEVFEASKGSLIKLRILSSCSPVPFRIYVQDHMLQVVARDGKPIEPFNATSLMIDTGQRLDVLVRLDQEVDNYLIAAAAVHIHGTMHGGMHMLSGSAILRYKGAPIADPSMMMIMEDPLKDIPAMAMRAPVGSDAVPNSTRVVVLDMDRVTIPDVGMRWHLNGGSLAMPSTPLLSLAYGRGPVNLPYVLHFERDEVVDFIFNNVGPSTGPHPWHPHGHEAWFLGSGVDQKRYAGQPLSVTRAPRCDVFTLPHNGWAAVRLKLDHSGMWLFHCHISPHHMAGMGFVLAVSPELSPSPPAGFPECDDYPSRINWREAY